MIKIFTPKIEKCQSIHFYEWSKNTIPPVLLREYDLFRKNTERSLDQ